MEQLFLNDIHDSGMDDIELGRELGAIHLPCLPVAFVEDILVTSTESSSLRGFNKLRDVGVFEILICEIDQTKESTDDEQDICLGRV